jgi:hypothetical protein
LVIYCITNTLNGKKYIGQTVQDVSRRVHRHKTGPYAIGNAYRKYGEENFKVEILFNSFDVEYLNNAEKSLIKVYNTIYPNGYNLMEGGQIRLSKESIEKMRQSKLGKKENPKNTENRMRKIRKPVICIEDQICFRSVKEAAGFYKGDTSHLSKLLKGKCKTFKGKTFSYINKISKTKVEINKGDALSRL